MKSKVASIQYWFNDNDSKNDRIEQMSNLIDQASGADLIVLPEMWNVGFLSFENYDAYSEKLDGPTISMVSEKAKKLNSYIVAGTIIENDNVNKYNTAVLISPNGKILTTYRKIHLVARTGAAEANYLKPGKTPVTIETDLGIIGFGICRDLRFPELYRYMAIHGGAEIFVQPAAWASVRGENWVDLTHARAIENQAYLISCNICGVNKGVTNFGHSSIVDPHGISIVSSGLFQTVVKGEIDINELRKFRKDTPYLKAIKLSI